MTSSIPVPDSLLVHAAFVRRLARGLAGPDADDLVQDTWTAALQARRADLRSVPAWLATITRNVWRNRCRGSVRRARREGEVAAPSMPSIGTILEREEVRRQVVAAVAALPERLRAVVLLRYYEDLDSTAIGRRLGLPPSTVRTQLRDAHAWLRRRLDAEHGERRAAWVLPLAGWLPVARIPLVAAVLRTAWLVRAVGVVAVLLLAWLTAPLWLPDAGPPPVPPIGPAEVAAGGDPREASRRDERGPERQAAAAERAALARGPEDLWGRVVAAADGTPIAGAEVELEHRDVDEFISLDPDRDRRGEIVGTARSDAEGGFAFRVERAWQHRLTVRAAGFATVFAGNCSGGSEVVVRLARPASVAGTVRTKGDGAPLAGVTVEALVRGGLGEGGSTRTAADGSFVLDGLAPRPTYVWVRAEGRRPSPWQLVALEPGQLQHVDIEVAAGRTLRGIVRDEGTGQPIGDARIGTGWVMRDAARSAPDGTFELRGLGNREELHVRADGYADLVHPLPVAADLAQVELKLARGNVVTGRVVDAAGRAVPGTYVAAAADQWAGSGSMHTHWRAAAVAADGRFRIERLAANWSRGDGMASGLGWQLLARAPRHGTHVLVLPVADLARGNVDVGEIVLAPQAILEGRLVEEDGRPIAGASVTLSGHAADIGRLLPAGAHAAAPLYHFGHRQSRTAGDGAFRFAGLAAGSYSVRAELDGQDWEAKGGPYEVRDGQVLGVADVVVPGGLAIEGVVRVPGALRADQRIELTARGAQGSTRSALVGRDGSFRLERLAAGNYLLFASTVPEGFVLAPRRDVAAGTKGLELDLVPAAVLEGRVVDDAGEPVRGASIYFFPEGVPTARNVLSGADGRFRLEVPPGVRGKLGASHPDVMMRQVHMPDVEAPRSDLVLRLPK